MVIKWRDAPGLWPKFNKPNIVKTGWIPFNTREVFKWWFNTDDLKSRFKYQTIGRLDSLTTFKYRKSLLLRCRLYNFLLFGKNGKIWVWTMAYITLLCLISNLKIAEMTHKLFDCLLMCCKQIVTFSFLIESFLLLQNHSLNKNIETRWSFSSCNLNVVPRENTFWLHCYCSLSW